MSQALISDKEKPSHEPFSSKDSNPDTPGCPDNDGGSTEVDQEEALNSQTEGCHLATSTLLSPASRLHMAAVKVHAVVKFTKMQQLKRRARWATKKLIVFVLSHVGLTFLVVLYAIAGGFIFLALESNLSSANSTNTETLSIKNNITAALNLSLQQLGSRYAELLWNKTVSYNILHPSVWKDDTLKELHQFAWEVYCKALRDPEGTDTDVLEETTSSDAPCIEDILSYRQRTDKKDEVIEWTYPRALLFAVTVITTIGYGDTVPRSLEAKVVCIIYATFGIPMTLLCLANIGSLMASVYRFTWKYVSHLALVIIRSPARNDPTPETSQVRVPVTVSLATMIGYILGGAVIFSTWEGWTYIDGSYFCFVTLSTIGFGDFVPGKKGQTFETNTKRVVCALYLLFGLALLSMVFQLIQDSVLVIVSRYASLLGLSESKIEKDIDECADNEKPQTVRCDDANKEISTFTGEKISGEKPIVYPNQDPTNASLPAENYQRFLDVAKSVSKGQQQSTGTIPESKKKQLKVTYKLHPASKERATSQGYNQVNTV